LERVLTEQIEVRYDEERWKLLEKIRSEAYWMIRPLTAHNIQTLAYGSVARGDVSEGSDIDIFIPRPPSPIIVEAILERSGIASTEREIVQATPSYAAKGYIYIGERRSYSFSLVDLRSVEIEFYGFAGSVDASQIEECIRVPGVDKKLMLIVPTESGHLESPVTGREGEVAGILGINVAVVLDRVRTLTRREEIGRTGVFLSRNLAPDEGFGEVFQELSRQRPAIRRRLRM
jgi:predicted nucleotidyltransferase